MLEVLTVPIKKGTCGIYAITTPSGSTYVGSSVCIERRFNEHRSMLKRGKHHSSRLQAAYNKHKDSLVYTIVCECAESELVTQEQSFINELQAKLNVATDVNNVWTNPEVRAKLEATYRSDEYRAKRSIIAKNNTSRWRAVDCSNGTRYPNMAEAAKAFGVRTSHIKAMVVSGLRGTKLKERFKFAEDEWIEEISQGQRIKETRQKNGTNIISSESRAKMSAAKKGKPLSPQALQAAVKRSSIAVVGVSIANGTVVSYPSAMEAARNHSAGVTRTAASQINKCIKGVKKSAYGYIWSQR